MMIGLSSYHLAQRLLIVLFIFLFASLLMINNFQKSQSSITSFEDSYSQVKYVNYKQQELQRPENMTSMSRGNSYLVNTKGCRIPNFDPFEPSVTKYIHKAKPIICDHGTHLPLVDSNNSAIFIDPVARTHFYNENEKVDCCWRTFWRSGSDNHYTLSRDCHPLQDVAFVNDEFIKVECHLRNKILYQDFFAFTPRKLHVEERCRKQQRAERLSFSPNDPSRRKLSVLVLGVDTVSRLNLHRSMPRTVQLLQDFDAVEMLGYNKVADNTYPNLVAVLSGMSDVEFEKICWKDHKQPFDDCPLIWKDFSARGYRTAFGEDACDMATFHFKKPGFKAQPTDYYLRAFCIAAESEIGNTHKLYADLCLGTRLNFEQLLNYARKFASEFADDPYFGFFWEASLTHDFIEYPQLGDDSYRNLLAYLNETDQLRNVALIFMSDHGIRWGPFRQTHMGRIEESLPFLFLRLPEWWKQLHPDAWDNLKQNAGSLTTPFDLHETLLDILDPIRVPDQGKNKEIPRYGKGKGISLFSRIPDERTCETAGIPEHYCMCHSRRNVSRDDPNLSKVTSFLVDEMNDMLAEYPQCARLQLHSLLDAKIMIDVAEQKKSKDKANDKKKEKRAAPWVDYLVTLQTRPGDAVFESSVRYSNENGSLSLVGSISRLNAYGNQSACVDDFHLRLYCYCQI